MCVYQCVCLQGINNLWHDMVWYRQFLVTQYVVNTCLEDQGSAELATEGTPDNSNMTYKGEWADA